MSADTWASLLRPFLHHPRLPPRLLLRLLQLAPAHWRAGPVSRMLRGKREGAHGAKPHLKPRRCLAALRRHRVINNQKDYPAHGPSSALIAAITRRPMRLT